MNYYDPPVIALNLIEFIMFYAALNDILTRRGRLRSLIGTIAVILPVYYLVSSLLPPITIVRLLFGVTIIFVPVALFYSDPLIKRAACYMGAWMAILVTETIIGLAFSGEAAEKTPIAFYIVYLIVLAMLLFAYVLTVHSFDRKYKDLLRPMDRLMMALFLLSQTVMLFGLLRLVWTELFFSREVETPVRLIILALVLCALSDVLLFRTLTRSARATRTELENAVLTRQVEDQKKYYASLNARYETIRRMRHDIANHIYTVEALLNDRKIEEAEKYTEKLSREHEALSLSRYCDHPVVDSFLSSRLAELEDAGIRVQTDVCIPFISEIDGTELITALGNLLDNAEEACCTTETPEIDVKAGIRENVLILRVRNPVSPEKEHKNRIPGLSRGTGTLILRELAEKYSGHYALDSADGYCTATLYLRLPEPGAAAVCQSPDYTAKYASPSNSPAANRERTAAE